MSKWDQFVALRKGGPYGPTKEIFKCKECSGETVVGNNWKAAPSRHNCGPDCKCNACDWFERERTQAWRKNFDRIFPDSPGSGL